MDISLTITTVLAPHGLILRGGLNFTERDAAPPLADGRPSRSLAMIGHAGSQMWPHVLASLEAQDGAPDPLDRWSRRLLNDIARTLSGRLIMPSDGPPYWPFQAWAQRCETVWPSPIGMLIHPDYGLWHGYRGAIALPDACPDWDHLICASAPPPDAPCQTCPDRPCLTACPVDALEPGSYRVARCRTHLADAGSTAPCFEAACLARAACPIGTAYRYIPAHARFHTEAFAGAGTQRAVKTSGPDKDGNA